MSTTKQQLTGDARIDGILSGTQQWSGPVLTFSFATSTSTWNSDYTAANALPYQPGYAPVPDSFLANLRQAFATWSSYLGITFTEVKDDAAGHGDIRLAFSEDPLRPNASLGTYPGDGSGGDVWLNSRSLKESDYAPGSGYYQALMHEIGHALGLKHPFEVSPGNAITMDAEHATRIYTIMAYQWDKAGVNAWPTMFMTTPMPYDILAAQTLYGANPNTNAGDTVYTFKQTGTYFQTIYDAGGSNTFAYSGGKDVRIDLHDGAGSYVGVENWLLDAKGTKNEHVPNVWIAYGTLISQARGDTGNDILIANDHGNTLSGGAGNDQLYAGAGSDTLDGGSGFDTVVYASKLAQVSITMAGDHSVTVVDKASQHQDALVNVERIHFSDHDVAFDIDGNAGKAYRLYRAAFDRAPDEPGLGFWIGQLDKGANLVGMASGFLASQEFQQLYGINLSNGEFLSHIYQNVLHRAPDQAGYAYWLDVLDHGANRALVLAQVSESAENIEQVAQLVANGIAYIPYA
jgi:Ca2+-binding RTX toxin-like protein